MDKKIIDEINALAKKQREEGLTEEEKARQAEVRKIYLEKLSLSLSCGLYKSCLYWFCTLTTSL